MANEEGKDGLFAMNLGDGLIEIDEEKEKVEGTTTEKVEKKPEKEEFKANEGYTQHEDGTIEIDEYLQKAIDTSPKGDETEGDKGDKDGTVIEKTEKEKKEQEKTSSDGDDSGDSSPSSPYLAFARDRASEGVFLDFNDEDWEVLVERNEGDEAAALRELSSFSMQKMIEEGIEQYKQSLTDEEKALYEAKEKGIPVDVYGIAKANLDKYSKIKREDLKENEKLQEEIVSKALELRGFSPEEISDEIEGYKSLENLELKAEKALDVVPKAYKKQIQDLEDAAAAEEQSRKDKIRQGVAKMKKLVETTPEIIPGIQLDKKTRENIMKSMTEPVARDANGTPLNPVMHTRSRNPEAFEMMIHYYHQLGLFNIDENGAMKPDFSKISKTAKKETVDQMRAMFESKEKQVVGKTKTIKSKTDEDDEFDKAFRRL